MVDLKDGIQEKPMQIYLIVVIQIYFICGFLWKIL